MKFEYSGKLKEKLSELEGLEEQKQKALERLQEHDEKLAKELQKAEEDLKAATMELASTHLQQRERKSVRRGKPLHRCGWKFRVDTRGKRPLSRRTNKRYMRSKETSSGSYQMK